ncbi:DUF5723 family protein [Limibacter armeniacum]|uniref:DUF5723 family protein n=1 Tax=Limibacter armeniacum TaxID=466084 RepID=UPI002FE66D17
MPNKSSLLIIAALLAIFNLPLQAQFEPDISSRYIGIRGMRYQPANTADTPFKLDINVAGANISALSNNYLPSFDIANKLQAGGLENIDDVFTVDNSRAFITGNIQLPSVLYAINDRSAVSLTWEIRAFGIYNVSELELFDLISGRASDLAQQVLDGEFVTGYLNMWMEIGAGYARSFDISENHRVKFGGKFKILSGTGSAFFDIDNIGLESDINSELQNINAEIDFGFDNTINDLFEGESVDLFKSIGYGLDFGAVYEYRPQNQKYGDDYQFRVGFTVNDIGSIKYKDSRQLQSISVSADSAATENFAGIHTLEEAADALEKTFDITSETNTDYRIRLPLSLILQFDYNFGNNFYLHVSPALTIPDFDLLSKRLDNIFALNVIPRYEKLRWGTYLPLTYNNVAEKLNVGIGGRWRFISVGSYSLISKLFDSENSLTNLFVNFRIPIYKDEFKR